MTNPSTIPSIEALEPHINAQAAAEYHSNAHTATEPHINDPADDVPQSNASVAAPKRKNQSVVWDYFTEIKNPDGTRLAKPKSKCIFCPQEYYCHAKSSGTTNMRNHLMLKCKKSPLFIHNKKQKQLVWEAPQNGGSLVAKGFNEDVARVALARMVIMDELPFSFVEGEGFQEFIRLVQPMFKNVSRRTVTRDIWELFESEKGRMKKILAASGQRVTLTTDTWTSIQNINYMVLTAHFIDENWVLHKKIMNFCVILNHRGKTIGQLVETCLMGWGIEKVFSIVVDNASPNQVALDYMREKIGGWNELVLDGELLHLRCCCHILNLVVKDGMAQLDSSVEGIRNCVRYIRSSPARLAKFRTCATQEKIEHKGGIVPLDVCTRWNSTYLMLETAVKYRKAFRRMEDEDPQFEAYFEERSGGKKRDGPPKGDDWDKAVRLVKFLKIFYKATLRLSGTHDVTANEPLLWMSTIVGELEKCSKGDDALLVNIAKSMKMKFDKYWGKLEEMNKVLLISVVLDPRYKLLFLDYFFTKLEPNKVLRDIMIEDVKNTLLQLYNEYAEKDPEMAKASECSSHPENSTQLNLEDEDSYAADMSAFMRLRESKDVVEIKNEVDKYLLDASESVSNPNFKLLKWWKENSGRFPILSLIAKDVLAIPASTVASESAFSLGSRILDPFRASLTPNMVEALVCTSDWIRSSGKPLIEDSVGFELEQYAELEEIEAGSVVPQTQTNAAT